jgi:nucleoside-diphosphate-sugar epimerase
VQTDIPHAAAVSRACTGIDVVYHAVAQVPSRRTGSSRVGHVDGTHPARRRPRPRPQARARLVERDLRRPGTGGRRATAAARGGIQCAKPGERLVASAARDGSVDATIIRPRTILGHGRLGIFQILFDWVAEGRNIPVLGRGDNVYQFVHADDLADAMQRAAMRPGFAIYHCGAARYGTMRETLDALCRHAGTGSRVVSLPMGAAKLAMRLTGRLGLSPLGRITG